MQSIKSKFESHIVKYIQSIQQRIRQRMRQVNKLHFQEINSIENKKKIEFVTNTFYLFFL